MKYLLIAVIGILVLGVGVYYFYPELIPNLSGTKSSPANLVESTPTPVQTQISDSGDDLDKDSTAIDRDLEEINNLEVELDGGIKTL